MGCWSRRSFAANTLGAEVLYQLVKDSMNLDQDTVVLDICCGTGTIGIILAQVTVVHWLPFISDVQRLQNVKQVVGIEMIREAVEDAKRNAQLNSKWTNIPSSGSVKLVV